MKSLSDANRKYGKLFLVASSLIVWGTLFFLFKTYGYEETWKLWRVPVEPPQFSDFRLIPGSAESFRMGIEPTQRNPGDPHKRIFNYPAFWRLFFYTSLKESDTIWIVSLMLVFFFVGVFIFPQDISMSDAFVLLLVVFSPAVMLLYERGNADLIVFFLCALVVWSVEFSALISVALLTFAILVKIFPFFGVTVFLRESKARFAWLSLGCLAVLVLYLYSTSGSVKAAWNLTMRGDEISYGANVLFLRYSRFFSNLLGVSEMSPLLKFGPIVLAAVLIMLVGMAGLGSLASWTASSIRDIAAFRMGASIYVGTFLLGNNWDYRLAFLIFAMPQLLQWSRASDLQQYRFAAITGMVLIFLSCWHFMVWFSPSLLHLKELLFVVDELLNWSLVLGLSYLLCASMPHWIKENFQYFSAKRVPTPAKM